jgi:hypothetical protein
MKRFDPHKDSWQDTVKHMVDKGLTNNNKRMMKKLAEIANDKKDVSNICKREIDKLMRMAAEITGMTHKCRLSGVQRLCSRPSEMRKSWCEDGGARNIKQVLWMFHQLPWRTHQAITIRERNHQDLVEEMVMDELHIDFEAAEGERDHRTRNCIQQTYSKMLNNRKQDIMKKGHGNYKDIQAGIKQPSTSKEKCNGKKHKRSKSVFYWRGNDTQGNVQVYKVSMGG